MTLPPIQGDLHNSKVKNPYLEDFKLQTILSLQHLWRIGREMDISWWTSAVAYFPRGSEAVIQKRARIAGLAWAKIHARNIVDEDGEDEETRDLWEEKHYAGMEKRGGSLVENVLPDWETVEVSEGVKVHCPPSFAVEVEELPRGGAVEWHAHLGIVGGGVNVSRF
jgi:diphthine-ammonia ligase